LLSSVPRSFSRLLPFGRSSERSEARCKFYHSFYLQIKQGSLIKSGSVCTILGTYYSLKVH
jgi:hypothetical protein